MFSFPDNTPDLDSMMRLWCHETIRVLVDGEADPALRSRCLSLFDQILKDDLHTSIEKLFPSKMISAEVGVSEGDDESSNYAAVFIAWIASI